MAAVWYSHLSFQTVLDQKIVAHYATIGARVPRSTSCYFREAQQTSCVNMSVIEN